MSALAFFSPIILIFFLAVGGTLLETAGKRFPKRGKDEPPLEGCTKGEFGFHKWNWSYGGWNSGIYHHGAVGRSGHRCYHCGEMVWKETDEEFITRLAGNCAWMLRDPECKIPEKFIQYIPQEILDKRNENIHNRDIERLKAQAEYHAEQEDACNAELYQLQYA